MPYKKDRVIFIASRAYIDNDPILPLILTLAYQGADIEIIFETTLSRETVKISSSWWNWLIKFTRCTCLEFNGRNSFVSKAVTNFRKIFFLLRMMMRKSTFVMVSAKYANNKILKALTLFCNVWHYEGMGLFDKKDRIPVLGKNLTPEQRIALGKPPYPKKKKIKNLKKMIFLSKDQSDYEDEIKWEKSLLIPFPHMQEWWREFMKANPPSYGKKEINEAKEIITIILLRKGNYYYAEGSDVDVLLDEIISVVRKHYPDILIVLKPKFEWVDYWLAEKDIKNKYKDDKIVMSYDSIISLSLKTLFAVSTCQSSAYYYMLSNGVPVIEYGRYSDVWKKVFSQVTFIKSYGGIFTETVDALDAAVSTIAGYKVNLDSLKRKISYKDVPVNIGLFE